MKSITSTAWVLLLALAFVASCSDNDATTIWDAEVAAPSDTPQITSISPEGGYLAGIDAVTINGSGFSPAVEENRVYFSSAEERGLNATILSATANQLVIRPPQLVGDDLEVFTGISGSENFSNILNYSLAAPLLPGYTTFNVNADQAITLGLDADEDLYVALVSGGNPRGVVKVDFEGEEETITTFVEANNRFTWNAIDFVTDGRMYICVGLRAVFIGNQGQREAPHFIMPNPFRFVNFDMDDQGHMWIVGDNTHIVRHEPQPNRTGVSNINNLPPHTKVYPLDVDLSAITYFQDALYVVGKDETAAKVWKLDLDANRDMTQATELINLSDQLGDVNLGSDLFPDMVMGEDGMIYIATNRPEGIIQVAADGSSASGLYPGVIFPTITSMDWGSDEFLYVSLNAPTGAEYTNNVLRINMQKLSAPDF